MTTSSSWTKLECPDCHKWILAREGSVHAARFADVHFQTVAEPPSAAGVAMQGRLREPDSIAYATGEDMDPFTCVGLIEE